MSCCVEQGELVRRFESKTYVKNKTLLTKWTIYVVKETMCAQYAICILLTNINGREYKKKVFCLNCSVLWSILFWIIFNETVFFYLRKNVTRFRRDITKCLLFKRKKLTITPRTLDAINSWVCRGLQKAVLHNLVVFTLTHLCRRRTVNEQCTRQVL